ncbi:MAG: hypothetical protein QXI42_04415 [Thermoproteota archaeon]
MLTSTGEAGQLSSSSVLKRFAQGLYAWVTPAIWDLAENTIRFGAWLKGKLTLPDVSKLIFADQASKSLGETVGEAFKGLKGLPDGGEPEAIVKGASNIVERVTLNSDVPESIATRMLNILSKIGEEYVGREDWGEKTYQVAETMVEAWKRVSKLYVWEREGEPGKLLLDLLEGIEVRRTGESLDMLQRISKLRDEELENVGKVLTVNPNTEILKPVLEEPGRLEELLAGIKIFEFAEPKKVTLNMGKDCSLHMGEGNELKPGTYMVKIHWEYGVKNGVMEFPIVKEVESHRVSIQSEQVDQVLKEIGEDRADILVAKAEFLDYRLFFPRMFSARGIEVNLDIYGNKMELNGRGYEFRLKRTRVHDGKLRVYVELQAKNLKTGEWLMLSFSQDGRVGMELGERPYSAEEIRMNDKLNYIEIAYSEGEAEYSFNLKPLSEQIGRYSYEIPLREGEGRSSIGLKEEMRRLLGYDAGTELEEGMGSKYGLLAGFDNGRKAYTGASRLVITVPEGASKIEWVEIVSIEDKNSIQRLLHEVIETKNSVKIGEAGERIAILREIEGINYQKDILAALSKSWDRA